MTAGSRKSNNQRNLKAYVYAACDVFYGSFYIRGLYDYFGKKNVQFDASRFPKFGAGVFAVVIEGDGNAVYRIIIDFHDTAELNKDALRWCKVYGKINLIKEAYGADDKVLAIGPGFAVRVWNFAGTVAHGLRNYMMSAKHLHGYKKFFSNYKQQWLRPPLPAFTPQQSEKNYVFILNSIWKRSPVTNSNRLAFIKACKAIPGLSFEGGFAPRQNRDIHDFDAYTTASRYSAGEYFSKTKRSSLVFNTPAVLDCHGWKLGEYLALGKAILSTPLSREMPGTFLNGVHYYETDSNGDYTVAIKAILEDDKLRHELEKNALTYYQQYLAPNQVIARLMEKASGKEKL